MSLAQAPNIGQALLAGLRAVLAYIPILIGALLILLVGYIVAKVVQWAIRKGLSKLGVDRRLKNTHAGGYLDRMSPGASASRGLGRVAFWIIFVIALVSAIGALGIPAVTAFMNQLLSYVPNVIAAIVIFIIAGLVAGAVGGLVSRTMGDTALGKVVGTVGPGLVMGIGTFMILSQLGIAPVIVQITYTALIGALALGLALAFGLGGRQVAADMLSNAYGRAQEEREQMTTSPEQRSEAEEARARAQDTGWHTTPPGQTRTQSGSTQDQNPQSRA